MFFGIKSDEVRRALSSLRNWGVAISLLLSAMALFVLLVAWDAEKISLDNQSEIYRLKERVDSLEAKVKGAEVWMEHLSQTPVLIEDSPKSAIPSPTPTESGLMGVLVLTPTPAATPTPVLTPTRYELEVFSDEWDLADIQAKFTYPEEDKDKKLEFKFLDSEGKEWPNSTSVVYGEYDGRPSVDAHSECYAPWGAYRVQALMDGRTVKEKEFTLQAPEPPTGTTKTESLNSTEGFSVSDAEGFWTFQGWGAKRQDTYLLQIEEIGDNFYRVAISNLNTKSSASVVVNHYELVDVSLLFGYYNEKDEWQDGGWGGFTLWPAGQARVVDGGLFSASKLIGGFLDKGTLTIENDQLNLPRWFEPYRLPDGTWVTLDMVDQQAYDWLIANHRCPEEPEYQGTPSPKATEAKPTPTPTATRVPAAPPKSLEQAPFDKVSKLEAPASYLKAENGVLLVSGRGSVPLATCSNEDSATIEAILRGQGETTIIVWLWSGYAHSFETTKGESLWSPCQDWRPPEK